MVVKEKTTKNMQMLLVVTVTIHSKRQDNLVSSFQGTLLGDSRATPLTFHI